VQQFGPPNGDHWERRRGQAVACKVWTKQQGSEEKVEMHVNDIGRRCRQHVMSRRSRSWCGVCIVWRSAALDVGVALCRSSLLLLV
jgi:hypothetical protein